MEQGQKIVFRDGAAGGFEPAPLNRRCLPETTSATREAGASESAVTNMKCNHTIDYFDYFDLEN